MERILVTGGTGYIGSHTIIELYEAGHEIDILDNLFNSKKSVIDQIEKITGKRPGFFEVDLLDEPALEQVFATQKYDLVMHFAGLKAVGESVEQPLRYYENNVSGTINLLKCMERHGVKKIIFSSSATVYGEQSVDGVAVTEFDEGMITGIGITNPYGKTKYMIEEILKDVAMADAGLAVTILRYFNPVGNHASGLLGEDPNDRPNNLMPIVMKVAMGEIPELMVYGDDYETRDGSGVRDFIHVMDLARGHVAAITAMHPGVMIYNLGTGKGTSVFEMVAAFEKASGHKLPMRVAARRAGDLAEMRAKVEKAERELGWKAELTIEDAMRDTIKFLGI